jgi:predicted dehydrogenase
MSNKETYGFGIIGAGMIASFHAKSVIESDGGKLVALASRGKERAEKMSVEFDIPYYLDYEDLIKRDDIDMVNICTPSGLHLEPALAAAKHGKHVLVEKPIEITAERTDKMIKACEEAGVKLGCIFQSRFKEGTRKLRKAVNEGLLGKLVLGDAYIKWYRTQEYYDSVDWRGTLALDGGAALMNQSIHTIDLLQWIMGPIDTVYGKTGTFTHNIEGEDIGLAILTFKNGAFGVIEGSTSTYPGFPERLEIHGENGTIVLDGGEIKTWEIKGAEEKQEEAKEGEKAVGASDPMAISYEGHKAQINDMIDAIRNNRSPLVDGIEAKKSVELIRSIYQSSESGQSIKFP